MKRLFLLTALALPLAVAGKPPLDELLREALYTEEVTRDPAKAAEQYEALLERVESQRPLAASALFRLAEIRRRQGDSEAAVALYRQLLRDYSTAEAEAKLAREHLAELGGEPPGPTDEDPADLELARLRELATTAPDLLHDRDTLRKAIATGKTEPVRFLLEHGADPNTEDALQDAAHLGYIEIAKLLFEHGCKPDAKATHAALRGAILQQRRKMLAFLLEQGLDPNVSWMEDNLVRGVPLAVCLGEDRWESAEMLIQHGADVNHPVRCDNANGTLLHQAALKADLEAARFLLKHGANPSARSPDGGVTPLHLSVIHSHDKALASAIASQLLEAGADLEAAIDDRRAVSDKWQRTLTGTPLHEAVRAGNPEQVELLLAAGARVSPADLRLAFDLPRNNDENVRSTHAIVEALTKHAPKFDAGDASGLLVRAAQKGFDFLPFIEMGGQPTKDWVDRNFDGASWGGALPILNERFLFPTLASTRHVRLVKSAWHNTDQEVSALATRTGNSSPPTLARALLDRDISFHTLDGEVMEVRWILWRKGEDGSMSATDFDPANPDPLPTLQWGDLVEQRTIGQPVHRMRDPRIGAVTRSAADPRMPFHWNLRRRISFPVKLSEGDETRELTLRGDLLVYDPRYPEVPLVSVAELMGLTKPSPYLGPTRLTIHRKGWQDVVLECEGNPRSWPKFDLQSGDHLVFDAEPGTEEEQQELRRSRILLRVPGTETDSISLDVQHPALAPTLVEFLAAAYAPWQQNWFEQAEGEDPARLGRIASEWTKPVILPHPDFARLRIRRLNAEGEESELPVDLASIITEWNASAGAESARDHDIPLQAGDIIVLPLHETDEPWSGFTEAQTRFFKGALDGAIQFTSREGEVSLKEIDWQPARWTPTAGGLLPIAPGVGSLSTRAYDLGFSSGHELTRDGVDLGKVGNAVLRSGDRLANPSRSRMQVIRPRAITPPAGRQPRPREVELPNR